MSKRMYGGLLGVMAMMAMMEPDPDRHNISRQEDASSSATKFKAPAPLAAGMKEWTIDGKTVFAVTKRAAIKKANKIK